MNVEIDVFIHCF